MRHSTRLNKQYIQLVENIHLPHSFDEARNNKNWKNWREIMENELESLNKHNVWYTCTNIPKMLKSLRVNGYLLIRGMMIIK